MLRKDQIRIYPAKDGIGVGQKGQVETYLEIDLAAIDTERAGLLALIFSAEALEPNGSTNELLDGSSKFASQLGLRLRERIYEHVVPQLSKSVAEQLRDQGTKLDSDGLTLAYRLTLRILFRLLFQAYAEDRGLLPAGRNEGYDANSLKTIAKRIINTPVEKFGKSKTLWLDLVQVWNAIDEGNETWSVPAYNGGLFGTDPELHPEGAKIEKLGIQDDILGPVLQHLLIDISEDNVLGPVDFRSLSVREFGTIYEGLLESSLSVATENLTIDSKGAWLPAAKGDDVLAKAGDVYFHSASGERKASGSYFTPSVVVDHLIDQSLSPALDAHLLKIKEHLEKGDDAAAAGDFFDFRVADLAMGSGHFLVAAVDRIEAKMRTFLSEKETQIPGINAQLHRLAEAAKAALGKDESAIGEIEPAALLRRQIARRCIYGLDINPLAVELARLALWIHTFVPGLPMSSLDHGLVCANSLTGIGNIDEALEALQPDISFEALLPGQGRPVSFYESVITDNLEVASALLVEVASSDEANKSEVKAAAKIASQARIAAEPTREIFNVSVAARIGIVDPRNIFDQASLIEIGKSENIKALISELNPAHFPYLFPEVFLRERPGFDVILGNPPWEEKVYEEIKFWTLHYPGLKSVITEERESIVKKFYEDRPDLVAIMEKEKLATNKYRDALNSGPYPGIGTGHADLYKAFAWRFVQTLRSDGFFGVVFPRSILSSKGSSEWRRYLLEKLSIPSINLLKNKSGWIFGGIGEMLTVALLIVQKKRGNSIELSGPHNSENDFLSSKRVIFRLSNEEILNWNNEASFPALESKEDHEIFSIMKKSESLDKWENGNFRPLQGDFNQTTDKEFWLSGTAGELEVFKGESFNIWNGDTKKPFARASKSDIERALSIKRLRQATLQSSPYFGLPIPADKLSELPIYQARIAFRDIVRATDSRTMVVALIPPETVLTNKAPYFVNRNQNIPQEAFLLAVLSSIPLDWYAKKIVELGFNFHLINTLPIPKFDLSSTKVRRVIEISCELAWQDSRYTKWTELAGYKITSRKSSEELDNLTAELDAIVFYLYGLDLTWAEYVYRNFNPTWNYKDHYAKMKSYWILNER
jgi:hypothetical protein